MERDKISYAAAYLLSPIVGAVTFLIHAVLVSDNFGVNGEWLEIVGLSIAIFCPILLVIYSPILLLIEKTRGTSSRLIQYVVTTGISGLLATLWLVRIKKFSFSPDLTRGWNFYFYFILTSLVFTAFWRSARHRKLTVLR